jgi:hypothetical protein
MILAFFAAAYLWCIIVILFGISILFRWKGWEPFGKWLERVTIQVNARAMGVDPRHVYFWHPGQRVAKYPAWFCGTLAIVMGVFAAILFTWFIFQFNSR